MKVTIILIGKTEDSYLKEGIDIYLKRLSHYFKSEWVVLPNIKQTSLTPEQLKIKESEILISKIKPGDFVILLDEKGKELSSSDFASYLTAKMNSGIRSLIFIVGGAYGVSEELKSRADFILALSKMTFSHQMVRLILAEQLYRAMTIIKGEKYHHY